MHKPTLVCFHFPFLSTYPFIPIYPGDRVEVNARNEVILATGVIGTPQLLLLSGIGPSSAFTNSSIKQLVNSPDVGTNLADHPLVPNYFSVSSNGTWDDVLRNASILNATLGEWVSTRQGLFVDSPGNTLAFTRLPSNSSAFLNTTDPAAGPRSAHTELIFVVRTFSLTAVIRILTDTSLGWFCAIRNSGSTFNRELYYCSDCCSFSNFT